MTEADFRKKLAEWFANHKRDLPWRHTSDAYTIWISEIILQQTRVAQGLEYFLRFVRRFPTAATLATAPEEEVLKLWQGLGYYSRARNLHTAAKQIVEQFGGGFPENHSDILSLKGIGEYTAAAIASFAYDQPFAVVDGNVYRVLARFYGICTPVNSPKAKKEFTELAQHLLDKRNPATHNQAIMEFGALQCTPSSPNCSACPLAEGCAALAGNMVSSLPRKTEKKPSRNRYFNYFYIYIKGKILLHKRTENDIWKNLYEFPLIETTTETPLDELLRNDFFRQFNMDGCRLSGPIQAKHVLSHQNIFASFYTLTLVDQQPDQPEGFLCVDEARRDDFPFSRLSEIFMEKKERVSHRKTR